MDKMTSRPCRRARIIVYLAVGCLTLPAVVVLWRDWLKASKVSSRISSTGTAVMKRGYFRTGQWRADARTLVAAARWCFEPEFPVSGNPVNSNGVPVVASTNAVAVTRT